MKNALLALVFAFAALLWLCLYAEAQTPAQAKIQMLVQKAPVSKNVALQKWIKAEIVAEAVPPTTIDAAYKQAPRFKRPPQWHSWQLLDVQFKGINGQAWAPAPSGTFSYSLFEVAAKAENTGSEATDAKRIQVWLSFNRAGTWQVAIAGGATYNSAEGKYQATGKAQVPLLMLYCGGYDSGGDNDLFYTQCKPDNALALNNHYITQHDTPVEVLKYWAVRHVVHKGALDDATKATWFLNDNQVAVGAWYQQSPENQTKAKAVAVGTYKVTMKGKKNGTNVSQDQTVVIGELQSKDDFKLTASGTYKKDPLSHFVQNPLYFGDKYPAIYFEGTVVHAKGSPKLYSFKWGFIQSIMCMQNVNIYPTSIVGTKGNTVAFPASFYFHQIPPGTNDAPPGKYLYAGHAPYDLDSGGTQKDSPGLTESSKVPLEFKDNKGMDAKITFEFTKPNSWDYHFTVWQVAFHEATKQYEPLRQQKWTLKINTGDKTKSSWNATVVGMPTLAYSALSDGSKTTSSPYFIPRPTFKVVKPIP